MAFLTDRYRYILVIVFILFARDYLGVRRRRIPYWLLLVKSLAHGSRDEA